MKQAHRRNLFSIAFSALLGLLAFLAPARSSGQTTAWSARYNGPDDDTDRIVAMAVDDNRNVYVAGYSRRQRFTNGQPCGRDFDYVVIKYNPSGVQQWLRIYDGPGGSSRDDKPTAMALGPCDTGSSELCVFVTGESGGLGTDYATIKLSAASGAFSSTWPNVGDGAGVRRLSGGVSLGGDRPAGIAVDVNGNAYLTGRLESENGLTMGTVRYTPNGEIPSGWPQRFQDSGGPFCTRAEALSIALDQRNPGDVKVVVAGTNSSAPSGVDYDYMTVKYNAAGGDPIWFRRAHYGIADVATKVAIDSSGNVFVTGEVGDSGALACLIPLCLESPFGGSGRNGPGNGPIMSSDYGTIGYDPAGTVLWPLIRYDGGMIERALDLAFDANGDVIVTGYSGNTDNFDWATVKYTRATWSQQWARRYESAGNQQDVGFTLAVDGASNVYVTGGTEGIGLVLEDFRYHNARTIKYSTGGVPIWTHLFSESTTDNVMNAIALDAMGRVIVAGHARNVVSPVSGDDYVTVAIDNP